MSLALLINILISIVLLICISILIYDLSIIIRGYAPSLSSSKKAINDIENLLDVTPGIKIADFGSGTGKVIKRFINQEVKLTGYEINPILYYFLKFRFRRNKNVNIVKKNFLTADLKNYDVIIIYGIGKIMNSLEKIIEKNEITDLLVISNKFRFPNIPISKSIDNVHLYKF